MKNLRLRWTVARSKLTTASGKVVIGNQSHRRRFLPHAKAKPHRTALCQRRPLDNAPQRSHQLDRQPSALGPGHHAGSRPWPAARHGAVAEGQRGGGQRGVDQAATWQGRRADPATDGPALGYAASMSPFPPISEYLNDGTSIGASCGAERPCDRHVRLDLAPIIARFGDIPLDQLKARLRCTACGHRPGEIRLVAGGQPTS